MLCLFFRRPHNLATSSALMSLNSPSLFVQLMIALYCCSSTSSSSRNCQSVMFDSILAILVRLISASASASVCCSKVCECVCVCVCVIYLDGFIVSV